jgi:Glycosyltransferase sugar-binding region containing DXD motif
MFGRRGKGSSEPKLHGSVSCYGGLRRRGSLFISGLSLCLVYFGTIQSLSRNVGSNADRTHSVRAVDNASPTLKTLTLSNSSHACSAGLHYLSNNISIGESLLDRKIPMIIHQTSKSRCVTGRVLHAAKQWQQQSLGFSYFLHDDEAVYRLFALEFPEFPHLNLVSRYCVIHGTLAADLWRYLVLWVYGGIYADLDAVPARFNLETSIESDDDALFVVEQYHLLSQWFMAVSPRHPVMFYAVHHSLANLLNAKDTGSIPGMYAVVIV